VIPKDEIAIAVRNIIGNNFKIETIVIIYLSLTEKEMLSTAVILLNFFTRFFTSIILLLMS